MTYLTSALRIGKVTKNKESLRNCPNQAETRAMIATVMQVSGQKPAIQEDLKWKLGESE